MFRREYVPVLCHQLRRRKLALRWRALMKKNSPDYFKSSDGISAKREPISETIWSVPGIL